MTAHDRIWISTNWDVHLEELREIMQQTVTEIRAVDPDLLHPIYAFTAISMDAAETKGLANLLIEKGIITQDEYFNAVLTRMRQEIDDLRADVGLRPYEW